MPGNVKGNRQSKACCGSSVLAMLLILCRNFFRRTRQRAAHKTQVCPEQHGISGTAGEPAGTSDLTDERCGQNDRDGHAGDWGRSHLCAGYTVRRNAVPADPCPAEDGSALTETVCLPQVCGVAVLCEGGGDIRVAARITELAKRTAGSAIQPHLCGTAQGLRPCSFYKEERL